MIAPQRQAGLTEGEVLTSRRMIPFDYAFRYELTGVPETVLNSTVNVSIEAAFVAVSIGYGVIPEISPIKFGVERPGGVPAPGLALITAIPRVPPNLRNLSIGEILDSLGLALGEEAEAFRGEIGPRTAAVLSNGFKVNLDFLEPVLLGGATAELDEELLEELFQAVAAPPEKIQFLYAIFDEGTGREFQSEPILNIAGLGIQNGDRPFRYFAQPIRFEPRTTIRMEVREVSEFAGQLHVSLQGYKVLGGAGTPTGRMLRGRRRRRR